MKRGLKGRKSNLIVKLWEIVLHRFMLHVLRVRVCAPTPCFVCLPLYLVCIFNHGDLLHIKSNQIISNQFKVPQLSCSIGYIKFDRNILLQ